MIGGGVRGGGAVRGAGRWLGVGGGAMRLRYWSNMSSSEPASSLSLSPSPLSLSPSPFSVALSLGHHALAVLVEHVLLARQVPRVLPGESERKEWAAAAIESVRNPARVGGSKGKGRPHSGVRPRPRAPVHIFTGP